MNVIDYGFLIIIFDFQFSFVVVRFDTVSLLWYAGNLTGTQTFLIFHLHRNYIQCGSLILYLYILWLDNFIIMIYQLELTMGKLNSFKTNHFFAL